MQTPKSKSGLSEVPRRVSPRAVRQLKTTGLESNSASSSNQASRTPKERSPKVVQRRSPRSPVSSEKQRPGRISELESQISQLQGDLKKAKDQFCHSELWKKQLQQDTEDTKMELLAVSAKLEQSQKQLLELSASNETCPTVLHKIAQEHEKALQSEPETVQKELSLDTTLTSAESKTQQPEVAPEPQATESKDAKPTSTELESLNGNLAETLLQLESAKKTIEQLKSDDIKATEAYNSVSSDLDQSRAHLSLLEELVCKIEADPCNSSSSLAQNPSGANNRSKQEIEEGMVMQEASELESELHALKSEVHQLSAALEITETKYQEEQIRNTVQMSSTHELMEQSKATLSLKEGEFEAELEKVKADMEELKANLMDKETELQGISEENDELNLKLEKIQSYELAKEVKQLRELVNETKANLMDKETELQNISEENEMLKMEIKKRETNNGQANGKAITELEAAKNAEKEALTKLGLVMEDADKNGKRAMRTVEQLQAAQAANSEMEAELRRLKVQSDQWRKAAEAAAAMLSSGNNGNFIERTGSLDDNYNSVNRKTNSPYSEDIDDDLLKKKNGNMLKKIGVLWKKPHK